MLDFNGVFPNETVKGFFGDMSSLLDESGIFSLFAWDVDKQQYFVWPSLEGGYMLQNTGSMPLDDFLDAVIYEPDRQMVGEAFDAMLSGRDAQRSISYRNLRGDATPRWVNAQLRTSFDENGKVHMVGGCITNIEDLRVKDTINHTMTSTQLLSDYDTGLRRSQGYLAVFDVDDFKFINEVYERSFGDEILRVLMEVLEDCSHERARVYRLEDDRYAVIAEGVTEKYIAELYETVNAEFNRRCHALQDGMFCTLSCGSAAFPQDSTNISELVRYANNALKTAKLAGKNNIVFFALDAYDDYLQELGLRAELRRCVQADFKGFELHYQPQVSIESGGVVGAEALLRWRSEERGLVSPVQFIPILESNGLIIEVGRWVMNEAMRQCAEWRKVQPDFIMSINVSSIQLERDRVVEYVTECLTRHALPGNAIVLELTESEQLHNFNYFNESLKPLHTLGVSIAMDDFGTGYSSLGYFKELHINQIKIDRCFVTSIRESEYDFKMVEFVIGLAHSSGMEVCVEGVENAEELKVLMQLSPDILQGYFFGRPTPPDQFEQRFLAGEELVNDALRDRVMQNEESAAPSPLFLSAAKEYKSLIDELQQIVCVAEQDSGEVIYLNRAGRTRLGVLDYSGKACYEIMRECKLPCVQCMKLKLSLDDFQSWYSISSANGARSFSARVKAMPWDGRLVRVCMCSEVETETETQLRTASRSGQSLEEMITSCLKALLLTSSWESGFDSVLQYVGEYYKADRIAIFEVEEDLVHVSKLHEWRRESAVNEMDVFNNVNFARDYPNWLERYMHGQPVIITDLDDFAVYYPQEYKSMSSFGVRPFISVPFYVDSKLAGFVNAGHPRNAVEETVPLMLISYFLAGEFSKRRAQEKQQQVLEDGTVHA